VTIRRMIAGVAAAVVLLVGFASPAVAESWTNSRNTEGAAATCTVSTWDGLVRDQYAKISCSLKDTKCDNNAVYIEWWQDGYRKIRLNNTNGCNKTTYPSDTRYNNDGAFTVLRWRVCRDVPFAFDNCSSTVTHYTY
jgi:hypothetical protein